MNAHGSQAVHLVTTFAALFLAACQGAEVASSPNDPLCIPACEVEIEPMAPAPDPQYRLVPACCDPGQFDAAAYPYDHEEGLCVPFLDGGMCR